MPLSIFTRALRALRATPSSDPAALRDFLARQAAFVAQKTVVDYCRVKAGRGEQQTFANPDFQAALRHCRWQTYAGATQDMAALAEAWLRPHASGREAALAAALSLHLATLQAAPPLPADRLPLRAEAPLLATLPVHPDQRRGETPAIRGALRFHVVSTQQELERAFDPAGLAAKLSA